MILRKPYAFFIKIFKPMHIFMSLLTMFLIYKTNNILKFLNQYIHSNDSVVGEILQDKLVTSDLFVIPIAIIIFSLIFLGIMFNKKKPVFLYVSSIFAFLAIIIITLYSWSVLGAMEQTILSIKVVKLIHDLVVLSMIIEITFFILLVVRGLGINFKKFNFSSDISKFEISDFDNEEFELSINFDVDASKMKRKKRIRYFKYLYKENKFLFNISLSFVFCVFLFIFFFSYFKNYTSLKEGKNYNMDRFNLSVNNTILLNENFEGKQLSNNLIVVDISLQTNLEGISLLKKNFYLEIEDNKFYPETKVESEVNDLGIIYNEDILTNDYKHYLFVYEVPTKYLESEMFLNIVDEINIKKIKLNPKQYKGEKFTLQKKINEKLSFSGALEGVSFKIDNYDIKSEYKIKYNFCIEKNECLTSIEYIKPTINENFDKVILKIAVEYSNESKLKNENFYDFFEQYGTIQYKKGEKWFSQNNNFEKLKSKRINNKNNVYIGVDEDISDAESIKFVFNVRGSKYEYILK